MIRRADCESRIKNQESRMVNRCSLPATFLLKLDVDSRAWHEHRTAIAVVAGIHDVLKIERKKHSPDHVRGVVRLQYRFAPVRQSAIAEQKAFSAELKVLLVIGGDSVADARNSNPVVAPAPPPASKIAADRRRIVHFGVRKRFVAAFIPSETAVDANVPAQLLLSVQAEAILRSSLTTMGLDVRERVAALREGVHRLTVTSHVRVIQITEHTQRCLVLEPQWGLNMDLEILCSGAAHVPIQLDAVCHRRQQRLRESHTPSGIHVSDDRTDR